MTVAFLLSVPRSGSTLLSTLLASHPDIHCPPEPWLLTGLSSIGMPNPSLPANAQALATATEEFFSSDRLDKLSAAASAIYANTLASQDKRIFVDKTPRYYHNLDLVERLSETSKVIFLFRNPLDVAASYMTTWGIDVPQILSEKCDDPSFFDFVIGFRSLVEFSKKINAKVVHYESLVEDSETEVRNLYDYLGAAPHSEPVVFNPQIRSFENSALGDKKIHQTSHVHSSSVGSFRQVFNRDQLSVLLNALGEDLFVGLGYKSLYALVKEEFSIAETPGVQEDLLNAARTYIENRNAICAAPDALQKRYRFIESEKEALASLLLSTTSSFDASVALLSSENDDLKEAAALLSAEKDELIEKIASLTSENGALAARVWAYDHAGFRTRIGALKLHTKLLLKRLINRVLWRVASGRAARVLPKITVVTPCFNSSEFLAATIESVLTQDYPSIEYIVVDGGSTDETLEIIQRYNERDDLPHKISKVISEPDDGMYDALAKGFDHATGEILCYLNSDDLFEAGGLRAVGEHFAHFPKDKLIYHEDVVLVDGWKFPNVRQPENVGTSRLVNKHILFQDGVFWRKSAYDRVGGLNRNLRLAGDFDMWLRMSEHFSFRRRAGHVSCFRARPNQLSSDMKGYDEEMNLVIKQFVDRKSSLSRFVWRFSGMLQKMQHPVLRRCAAGRLDYFIDFPNLPPPTVVTPERTIETPRSPIDSRAVDRLLFSTPDTRFGDNEINYVYMDDANEIAVIHPKIDGQKLDQLYLKFYSKPPKTLKLGGDHSPYRNFKGRSPLAALLDYLPIAALARFYPAIWSDNTLPELQSVLVRCGVDVSKPLRFLDAGCFEGLLLDRVSVETRWRAFGLEPNNKAVEVARSKGHQVWSCHVEDAPTEIPADQQFDVIFMGQTIEHVDDPVRVLRRLRLLLAPGGLLVMSTPNLASVEISWFGPTWAHWHTPYHRHIFSKKGLSAVAKQVGLLAVTSKTFSNPYWTCMSLMLNKIGLGGAVSHEVEFPKATIHHALRIAIFKKLFHDAFGRGDYIYMAMKDGSND